MSVATLLEKLKTQDIKISLNGEQLKINAPKGSLTAELQAEIVANKQLIIQFLRDTEAISQQRSTPLRRFEHNGKIPLSFAQQRMWFLEQLESSDTAYILSYGKRMTTRLDKKVLEKCLEEITRRHEVLRSSFQHISEQPVQVIHPSVDIHVKVVNLEPSGGQDEQEQLRKLVDKESARPFDLGHAPLFRVTLFRLLSTDFLLVNMHHIIGDNASMRNLSNELSALYPGFEKGDSPSLPDLPYQYGDYVFWQQEAMQGSMYDEQMAFWREKLSGDVPRLELPTDHPWGEIEDKRAGEHYLHLTPALSMELEGFAQRQGVTLFNVLLAAFKVLLYRLSGQEDITLGTPVWGRSRPELESMIGLFLNTLTLRTDFSGSPSFLDTLARVNNTMLGAFANQEMPFERLVEKIQPERSLSHHPFFDIFINFLQPKSNVRDGQRIALEPIKLSEPETKFPITVYIVQNDEGIHFIFTYRKALYSSERMASMADEFQYLLEQIVHDPGKSIDSYSLVGSAARVLLPDPTDSLGAADKEPVFKLVDRWAVEQPDLPAVAQNGRSWTYRTLADTACSLAAALRSAGCKPGEVVAVTGQKSFGLIAGMLGVLQSGGVLLTLDPALPPRRMETMLQEADARLVVHVDGAGEAASPAVPPPDNIPSLRVSPETGLPIDWSATSNGHPFESPVHPEDPAYIFFTSGTTNVPKGVLGTHRGLSHFLTWQRDTFAIGPEDRAAQLTALSFDVVLRDVFTPLISGACLCLPDAGTALASKELLEWLKQKQITLMHTVPAIAFNWLNMVPADFRLDRLRLVFFAGEPLLDTLCLRWRENLAPDCQIVNLYGPTETTLAKCYFPVPAAPLPGVQPVGRPLPQTQALVLNKNGALCGIGEPGEIVIRTPFRTRGYINAAEEQKRRFLPNPFNGDPNDVVYYSGDNGRYRPDGSVDIFGRQDDQVKIHGVRIELGEVTAALLEHPDIKTAVVIARKEEGVPYLAAYAVTAPGVTIEADALRYHIAERVPLAMVPSRYVFLDRLPLNPNGKVDRSALPEPPAVKEDDSKTSQPRDVVEAKLIQIWKKLLRTQNIGIKDDFFSLGGHSMMAVQMFSQIQEAFGVTLPLTSLFQKASIEHLAELINQQRGPTTWASLVHIQPLGSRRPLFCVHGLTGDVFWFGRLVPHTNPDQPLWGLQSQGLDGIQEPLTTVEEMAALYIREMKSIQPTGPYDICGYSFGGTLVYEMACQLERQGDEVGLLAIIDHANAKSGYYQVKLNPRFFISVLKNLPHRINDVLALKPYQLVGRIERKLRAILKIAKFKLAPRGQRAEAGDIIDHATHLPEHVQKVIEANFKAAHEYNPGRFNGLLTVLRAQGGRLMVSHDPQLGWGKFAPNIRVRLIPGSHLSLFQPHRVQHLAHALEACLSENES